MSGNSIKGKKAILCKSFDVSKFHITEIDKDNTRTSSQYIAYPKYTYKDKNGDEVESNLVVKTGPIKIVSGGIPKLTEKSKEWFKKPEDRAVFKIPLDPEQPSAVDVQHMCEQLDEYIIKHKEEVLKGMKNPKDIDYTSIVREPQENEGDFSDDEKSSKSKSGKAKKTYPKYKYVKVKLDVDFNTKDILTPIYVVNEETKEMERVNVKSVSDVEKYFTWNCTAQFVIMPNKMWVMKTKDKSGKRSFGIGLKCLQIAITEHGTKGESTRDEYQDYAFGDGASSSKKDSKKKNEDKKPVTKGKKKEEPKDEDSSEDEKPKKVANKFSTKNKKKV